MDIQQPNFYSVIIGTELLNGRRRDRHFEFINNELLQRGFEQKASFIIDDDPKFMEDIFRFIKNDKNSVMFSFGGIGATPDDYTRDVAAKVFRDGKMEQNQQAKELILQRFGNDSYPHRINMANLPVNSGLLDNIVTNVPGFYLDKRFFFTPGFPSMAHHMVKQALDRYYPKGYNKYKKVLTALTSENTLIDVMHQLDKEIELSSLPQIEGSIRKTVIHLSGYNSIIVEENFELFVNFLKKEKIEFNLGDK
ncbi:MAG: competence/damage-inducible protein A [Arcobacter butzleri]|jgi:molybdopterin-biosynthesis enzyme MoeA-like protein|nr:molybdopterin-binding protein [Arcobacteraceae bacterium]MDY0365654.1 molybdopterin-binding protein [Arcobacteraceae bacterium]NLO16891.1 competence/damage-inducible protein A [Aliarcobacter butzleri]